jgi:rare lipoprotein A
MPRARVRSSILDPRSCAAAFLAAALVACGSAPKREAPPQPRAAASQKPLTCVIPATKQTRGGAYYLDDGPEANPPSNLDEVPDAIPRAEPIRAGNMKPYEALGKTYTPMTQLAPYKERGIASWYGRRYHGQRTASGEVYDMYGMTAAHPTLPIPSYVRVTNVRNGRAVLLRVNDRGPFHADRVIDLSFTAACKLDILGGGSQLVEVEAIIPGVDRAPLLAVAPQPNPPTKKEPAPAAQALAAATSPETPANGSPLVPIPAEQRPDILEALAPIDAADAGGFYLQLGAFGARDSADNFMNHLRAQMSSVSDHLNVRQRDGLYRVNAGPYPSQSDARKAAERFAQTLGFKPMVVSR